MNLLSRRGFAAVGGSLLPFLFGESVLAADPSGTNTNPIAAGQYPGANTNSNASTGNIGEFQTASLASTGKLQITTSTGTSVIGVSLTPGDWDVWGQVYFTFQATTVATALIACVATANSSTLPVAPDTGLAKLGLGGGLTGGADTALNAGPIRLSLAATQTASMIAQAGFGTSTTGVYGTISARRAR